MTLLVCIRRFVFGSPILFQFVTIRLIGIDGTKYMKGWNANWTTVHCGTTRTAGTAATGQNGKLPRTRVHTETVLPDAGMRKICNHRDSLRKAIHAIKGTILFEKFGQIVQALVPATTFITTGRIIRPGVKWTLHKLIQTRITRGCNMRSFPIMKKPKKTRTKRGLDISSSIEFVLCTTWISHLP
jgi:hypothetical protein